MAGDESAARAAAFARAKEQAGQTGRAALTGLRESLASRGMLGGGAEAVGTGQVVGATGGMINEFTRDQLMSDLQRSGQLADRNYAGGLQARGQDILQRGQDLSQQAAQQNYQQSLLGLMRSGGGVVY